MHCFYNAQYGGMQQPINYNDFTFFDFQIVCDMWSTVIFDRPLVDFKLSTRFEVGLNIEVEKYSAFDVIDKYLSFSSTSTNSFYTCPPSNLRGKPLQRMCYLSDYKLKVYDKSKQAELAKIGLLRYEVVYTELRKIRSALGLTANATITLQSLNSKEAWNKLFVDIVKMYDAIKKSPLLSDAISIEDIFKVHAYCNKSMADDIRRIMNPNSYKKLRASFKKVYNHYDQIQSNYHQIVRQKLVSKYNSLI